MAHQQEREVTETESVTCSLSSRGRYDGLVMFRSRFARDFDWVLLGFVLLLSLLSVLEIRSATAMTKFHGFQQKQMLFLGIGIVVMFLVSMVDYHRLLDISQWAYGISVVLLVAVLIPHVGQKVLGARRWINLGGGA